AALALSATAYRGVVFCGAGVFDLTVVVGAGGTAHRLGADALVEHEAGPGDQPDRPAHDRQQPRRQGPDGAAHHDLLGRRMREAFLAHGLDLADRVGENLVVDRFVRHDRLPLGIDGERLAEFRDPAPHALLDLRVALLAVLAHAFDDLGDQPADLAELGRPEPARRPRRRAEPDARSDERRARVERNAVLVAGQVRAIEPLLGRLAG